MSYDLGLKHPITGEWIELDKPHFMRQGTHCVTGTIEATVNITYNYAKHFNRIFPPIKSDNGYLKGIRTIYGLTGAESIQLLKNSIKQLGDEIDKDYWKSTEGNARLALLQCLALAEMQPDGIWDGD